MPKHDGKVVFDLEVDDSHIKADVNKALTGVEKLAASKPKVQISVNADTGAATSQLERVKDPPREDRSRRAGGRRGQGGREGSPEKGPVDERRAAGLVR